MSEASTETEVETETVEEEKPNTETEESETESEEDAKISKAEYDKLHERMRAADSNRSKTEKALADAQKQLQEIENSKLSEAERTKNELEEAKAEASKAAEELKTLRLTNAFLMTKDVQWADPEIAYTVLTSKYMDGVEVDDTGKVSGMADAIKKMAKDKAYLVSTNVTPTSEATGHAGTTKRKGEPEKVDTKKLAERFPGLIKK